MATPVVDGEYGQGNKVLSRHTAIFTLAEPAVEKAGTKLTVLMKFNHSAKQHVMGRFRVSVSNAGEPGFGSGELLTALQAEPAKRTVAMKEIVSKAYSLNDLNCAGCKLETDAAKKRINDLRKAFPKVMVMRDGTKRETRVLIRGVYNKPTDIVVGSNTPESLPPLPKDARATGWVWRSGWSIPSIR